MKHRSLPILCSLISILLLGCGTTKPYYNPNQAAPSPGKARIVFTREGEALGAAIKINVFEYGKNCDSNGIIAIRKDIYKNYPEIIRVDLLWFDNDLVQYISKGPSSGKSSDLKSENGEFLMGDLLLTCNNSIENSDHSFTGDKNGNIKLFNDDNKKTAKETQYQIQIQTNIAWLLNAMEIPIKERNAKIAEIIQSIRDKDFEPTTCNVKVEKGSKVVDSYYTDCYKLRDSDPKFTLPGKLACVLSFVSNENKFLNLRQIEDVRMIGTLTVGQTIVWDRQPGEIKLGTFDYSGGRIFLKKLTLEEGTTYYIRYDASIFNKPHLFLTDIVK
jgi:hypothetical protein